MNNSVSFTSRNPTIRFADDIARRINKCYPMVSNSKISGFNNADKFEMLQDRYLTKLEDVRNLQNFLLLNVDSLKEALQLFTFPIKELKIGNCGESVILSELAVRANGIRDCFHAVLTTAAGDEFDHAVLVVKNNNKPYIIDSWLGFADYIPKVIERYKSEFSQYFAELKNEKIKFAPVENCSMNIFRKLYPNYSEKFLKKLYPELVLKERGS